MELADISPAFFKKRSNQQRKACQKFLKNA